MRINGRGGEDSTTPRADSDLGWYLVLEELVSRRDP